MSGVADVDDNGLHLGVALRALRRQSDLSQRELAQRSGVPQSTLARIESGAAPKPSFRTVERLVLAAGGTLTVGVAADASVMEPIPHEELRDRAERLYPAHLDPVALTRPERWWGAWWASSVIRSNWPVDQLPPYTYDLSRWTRDERREREVRGAAVVISGGPVEPVERLVQALRDAVASEGRGEVVLALFARSAGGGFLTACGFRGGYALPAPAWLVASERD